MQNISRTREANPEEHDRGKDLQLRVIDFNERFSQTWRFSRMFSKVNVRICVHIYVHLCNRLFNSYS